MLVYYRIMCDQIVLNEVLQKKWSKVVARQTGYMVFVVNLKISL